jgi:hypothetical protein
LLLLLLSYRCLALFLLPALNLIPMGSQDLRFSDFRLFHSRRRLPAGR